MLFEEFLSVPAKTEVLIFGQYIVPVIIKCELRRDGSYPHMYPCLHLTEISVIAHLELNMSTIREDYVAGNVFFLMRY